MTECHCSIMYALHYKQQDTEYNSKESLQENSVKETLCDGDMRFMGRCVNTGLDEAVQGRNIKFLSEWSIAIEGFSPADYYDFLVSLY